MTVPVQENPSQTQENSVNNKEINFRALEARYEKQLQAERSERERLARELEERNRQPSRDEDDDVNEPYVDHRKLEKKLARFGQNTQSDIQKAMETAKYAAKEELKQEMWLENNPDFYDVLKHAEKFAQSAPRLAETILKMPEGFERQKLVYQTIKQMGIDKPEQKQSSIQEKIDANRRSPYYQPSQMGTSPYSQVGDFSNVGQKQAYEKMQELKSRLRI